MLAELQDLIKALNGSKKKEGKYNHKSFIRALKKANVIFDNDDHHDSHEFIGWLLDTIHENCLENMRKAGNRDVQDSFISQLFQGKL